MKLAAAVALILIACGHGDAPKPATPPPAGWWCYEFRSPAVAAGVCVRARDTCEHANQRSGDCLHRDVASCYSTRDRDDCAPSMDECDFRRQQATVRDGSAVVSPCAERR